MLQKYNPIVDYVFGDYIGEMDECADGKYYKVSDVDAILNSAQLLKAEIASILKYWETCAEANTPIFDAVYTLTTKLRQLSAVQ